MFSQTDMTFYAAFMVWLSGNAPELWNKVQHQSPSKARLILNAELGTNVLSSACIPDGIREFMRAVLDRNRSPIFGAEQVAAQVRHIDLTGLN